jgi:hypothetical protein
MIQIEVHTHFVEEYSRLFTDAFDFKIIEEKSGWAHLTHFGVADLMFFDATRAVDGESHWEIANNENLGKGIEIVLLTNDIIKVRKVVESYGYRCSPDRRPPWGSVEFLFNLHEGYLVRAKQKQLPQPASLK